MSTPLPLTFAVAAIPAGNYTPSQQAALIASRLTASSGETFAIFVTSTTEPTSNVGLWFDPVNMIWKAWDDVVGGYREIQYSPDRVKPGNLGVLGAINLVATGKRFAADYPNVFFKTIEIGTAVQDPYTTGTGTAYGFTLPVPVQMVCPGHPDAASGAIKILNPDSDGVGTIQYFARIITDSPNVDLITVFYQKNDDGAFIALAAISSDDASNQNASGIRTIAGLLPTDSVKFYTAPCNGDGDIASSITCRMELDIASFNG